MAAIGIVTPLAIPDPNVVYTQWAGATRHLRPFHKQLKRYFSTCSCRKHGPGSWRRPAQPCGGGNRRHARRRLPMSSWTRMPRRAVGRFADAERVAAARVAHTWRIVRRMDILVADWRNQPRPGGMPAGPSTLHHCLGGHCRPPAVTPSFAPEEALVVPRAPWLEVLTTEGAIVLNLDRVGDA